VSRFILRRLTIPHCARGPARCAACAAATETLALLDIDPAGEAARPVIAVVVDGVRTMRTFDVVRRFAGQAEARAFLAAAGLDGVLLDPDAGRSSDDVPG
jgi:hypothetical protein